MQIDLSWADEKLPWKLIEFLAEDLITCVQSIKLLDQISILMVFSVKSQYVCVSKNH